MSAPTVVVLAAGQGSRFRQVAGADRDKLLEPCAGLDGVTRPVLHQVLLNVAQMNHPVVVVTRKEAAGRLGVIQAMGVAVLLIDSEGMGDSLAAAVQATPDSAGWLVVLGDMPWVLPQTLLAVAAAISPHAISVPVGLQGRGHPVGFGREFAQPLMALSGDRGGKGLFTAGSVREIQVDDPGIYRDVDLPADLHG